MYAVRGKESETVTDADKEELRRACEAVAHNTVWDIKPFDSSLISGHAEQLSYLALKREYLAADDPGRLARAVHYLAQAMAIPLEQKSFMMPARGLHYLLKRANNIVVVAVFLLGPRPSPL